MKTKRSIKILFWSTHIATLLYFTLFIVFIAGIIGYAAGIRLEQIDFTIPLPAKARLAETGIWNNTATVELTDVSGELLFPDAPDTLKASVFVFLFIAAFAMGFALFSFRSFCKNIYESRIFDVRNSAMLKYVSLSFFIIWLLDLFYYQFAYHFITSKIIFQDFDLTPENKILTVELFMGLFFWVLALIFERGNELEEERKLTI